MSARQSAERVDNDVRFLSDNDFIEYLRNEFLRYSPTTYVRVASGYSYFFDDNEVYRKRKTTDDIWHFFVSLPISFNSVIWRKVAVSFVEGMSLRECISIYIQCEITVQPSVEYSELDRLAQKVERPSFEREPQNSNKNSFDRIRVSVCLGSQVYNTWGEMKAAVRKFRHDIDRMVIERIADDRGFLKYGVPVGFLRIANITLCRNYTLEYIFELKPIASKGGKKYEQ